MRFNPNRVPNLSPAAWRVLGAVLLILVLLEFFVEHYAHFGIDGMPGFFVLWGFAASAGLVLLGNLLGKLLKRQEDYYATDIPEDPDA